MILKMISYLGVSEHEVYTLPITWPFNGKKYPNHGIEGFSHHFQTKLFRVPNSQTNTQSDLIPSRLLTDRPAETDGVGLTSFPIPLMFVGPDLVLQGSTCF